MKKCFSTKKYLEAEEAAIRKRLAQAEERLYLEIGGKLLADYHAARTLPGYDPKAKILLLQNLKKDLEIIYCVSAKHLQRGKLRSDFNLTYGDFALRALEKFSQMGLGKPLVAINRYEGEEDAKDFGKHLTNLGYKIYFRNEIRNYPDNIEKILSKKGFGKDPYIPVKKPIVVVNGPGGNSGKLSTCLGQLYHEREQGKHAAYGKLETFPVWNLPLNHPVNIAYEASTADLGDKNAIDPFHLNTHKEQAVNYNRDIEAFPIIKNILDQLFPKGNSLSYSSPTEMGINKLKEGIINDKETREAAKQEIVFYYFRYHEGFLQGTEKEETLQRMKTLMGKLNLKETDRAVVEPARNAATEAKKQKDKGNQGIYCGAALELPNEKIVTGKNSRLMHAEAAVLLNALKESAKIPDEIDLIPEDIIKNLTNFKEETLGESAANLNANEVLLTLSLGKTTNPLAKKALKQTTKLAGLPLHTTHQLGSGNRNALHKLGIWATTDARPTKTDIF
ncbi:MAG: DUF1846 family protein [Patescibacteria group bacterium]|nr:DUF1846 family protein [Patescibacteria group bacterium]